MRKNEVIRAQRDFRQQQEQSLLSEINYLQKRLEEMGYNGDCAYERAIEGKFLQRLQDRRHSLALLRNGGRIDINQ
ncbi:MAG: hypothetical protein H7842_04910 [Gammaproteobacteria bacterium SHHR-1]